MDDGNIEGYTRMVVPSSMRSLYWKYFGFPSDSHNNILTKKKIICTLCNTIIAYNKNTSNLRTHLVAKHSEVLLKIQNDRKKFYEPVKLASVKRPKLDDEDATDPETEQMTIKITNVNAIMDVLENENDMLDQQGDKSNEATSDFQDFTNNIEHTYEIEEIDASVLKSEVNFMDLLQEMLIKDLFSPLQIEGPGFRSLVSTLSGNLSSATRTQIDAGLNEAYKEKYEKVLSAIQTFTANNPYTLSIETWKNIEKKTLISVYFNYITNETEITFHNVLYKTVELSKCSSIQDIIDGINLQNCTGAVVNCDNSVVNNLLSSHDVQTAVCYEATINKCLSVAFELPSIITLFAEISDFFEKHPETYETDAIPNVLDEFPWTKYNVLKYFYENVSWTDDSNELLIKTKGIIDCLSPLKVTLETLADEPLPLSSVVRPLTTKLMEQHFCAYECDIEIVLEVKEAICQELTQTILSNRFLTEAAFLDPRFQQFLQANAIQLVRNNLLAKYNTYEPSPTHSTKFENSGNSNRRSSLKLFFNRSEQKTIQKTTKSGLELELTKYVTEAFVDLEQCPVTWWNDIGYVYRNLKKISERYFCLPCCINLSFKRNLDEQIEFIHRRFMLRGKYVNQLWFLHHNKDM